VLIIGGGMANTFLLARGVPVGKSLAERDLVRTAREILDKAKLHRREIVLPVDAVVAEKIRRACASRVVDITKVGAGDMILRHRPAQHRNT